MTAVMFGFVFGQTPIIRVKQIGEWKTQNIGGKTKKPYNYKHF